MQLQNHSYFLLFGLLQQCAMEHKLKFYALALVNSLKKLMQLQTDVVAIANIQKLAYDIASCTLVSTLSSLTTQSRIEKCCIAFVK